jgi:hypothetical protein
MNLTDKDKSLFRRLHDGDGPELIDYIRRLKVDLFNPDVITKDNLDVRKDALKLMDEHIVKLITSFDTPPKVKGTDYR